MPKASSATTTAARLGPKPLAIDSAVAATGECCLSATPSKPHVQVQANAKAKNTSKDRADTDEVVVCFMAVQK
jgi:hypothetical protein